ncbi:thiamine phosphate synthase [Palleronia sp. LCG004]|uniref:thiamine phosphate synthase n=1 Tax=Palleronia sp. LCG004 TaxID=3079304 RepID=UPI002943180B|nr:thiamine phosphate synthase [Palleronia sp. LCG004]WOI57736.1 thiamine phosphate synthase [Palleronia sp. LCG004]
MIPPLYFVTDPGAPLSIPEQAERAARGGAGWVQLRHKTLGDTDFADLARTLIDRLTPFGVALIVNDRVEIARQVGAAGLHTGQGDGDPMAIRDRIGPDMIFGLSVETDAQIAALPEKGLSYLGVGPMRATASKPDHAPPIGLHGIARIVAATPLPCFAIGGVGPGDMAALRRAGCAGAAVISAISRAADPEAAAKALIDEWTTT